MRRIASVDPVTIRRSIRRPKKKYAEPWILLTLAFALAVLLESGGASPQRALLVVLTIAGASLSQRCLVYNARELESQVAAWDRSFLCERCGNLFDGAQSSG